MKIWKSALFAIGAASFIGCAQAPVQSTSQIDKTYSVQLMSLRNETNLKSYNCPVGGHSWHQESLANLVKDADACEQYKENKRLEQIGNVLAERFSNEPWGTYFLSLAALDRKEYPRALWMVQLAEKKAPNTGLFYYQEGRIQIELSNMLLASQAFHKAVRFTPSLADAHLFLAQLAVRDQNYREAAQQYGQVAQIEPNNHQAFADLGETDIALNRTSDAIKAYETAVNLSPRNVKYLLRLGYLYETSKKDLAAALSSYRRARVLARETRFPASEMNFNLDDKIKELETLVTPAPARHPLSDRARQAKGKEPL